MANDPLSERIVQLDAALRRLAIAARTTGGTAGPDAELMAACTQAEDAVVRYGLGDARAAAQPQAPPEQAWRPIESAPKDGTPVLLRLKHEAAHLPENIAGICIVARNRVGDMSEWRLAGPFGYSGIMDEWIAGWAALPPDSRSVALPVAEQT